jgi:hypothetical protein
VFPFWINYNRLTRGLFTLALPLKSVGLKSWKIDRQTAVVFQVARITLVRVFLVQHDYDR